MCFQTLCARFSIAASIFAFALRQPVAVDAAPPFTIVDPTIIACGPYSKVEFSLTDTNRTQDSDLFEVRPQSISIHLSGGSTPKRPYNVAGMGFSYNIAAGATSPVLTVPLSANLGTATGASFEINASTRARPRAA